MMCPHLPKEVQVKMKKKTSEVESLGSSGYETDDAGFNNSHENVDWGAKLNPNDRSNEKNYGCH